MAAPHSQRAAENDKIFAVNVAAQEAAKIHGPEKVANASIGALLEDNGSLSVLPSIIDLLRNLSPTEYAAYAPIEGLPSFLEASKKAVFREQIPEGYIESIATPGGSGAIRHAIWNYSNPGDKILTSDWYWGPYKTIAEEHGRSIETYTLFNEKDTFNINAFQEKVHSLLQEQEQLVILLNSPAHNPTGYSLSEEEWIEVLAFLKQKVSDREKKIILFVDIAYIDFAGETQACRSFMKLFGGLPENILTIIAFSMSKGYTMYGMRSGAMLCVSSNNSVAEEFKSVGQFSNRGVWSNGTRPAMAVLGQIFDDPQIFTQVEQERALLQKMLSDRAQAFIENAQKVGLKICPYKAGFFITIPCKNPEAVAQELQKDLVFAVAMGKGIRFAVCAVSKELCAAVPEKLVKAIAKFE